VSGLRDRYPREVTVVEVGPRDGLQNESGWLSTQTKIRFIERLAEAGLRIVEATSFVDPQRVPQLADASDVLAGLQRREGVRYPVLVPNEHGLERALAAGADSIAIFGSASETFSQRNLGRSRADAVAMFRPVVAEAKRRRLHVRAYLSMVIADPWEGRIVPQQVVDAGLRLLELGADELSLGDTIGVGTPASVQEVVAAYLHAGVAASALAVHFHDTYGQALANVLAAMELGVSIIDASAGGLGGCPFAKSATGNLATEDLVWMLDGIGIETGVDVRMVASTSNWIGRELGHDVPGRVARALAGSLEPALPIG
jgi:hydroxymethylglutaryl-CoA lyase